jgi:hypothetical protein
MRSREQQPDQVPLILRVPRAMRDALKKRLRDERRRKPNEYITLTMVVRSLLAQGLESR